MASAGAPALGLCLKPTGKRAGGWEQKAHGSPLCTGFQTEDPRVPTQPELKGSTSLLSLSVPVLVLLHWVKKT